MINDELAGWLGGDVTELTRMLGGASRETWSFCLDGRPLVLRRDPPGAPAGGAMLREAALIRAAGAAGVPVPDVVAADEHRLVLSWLDGETIGSRVLRDERLADARAGFTAQAGTILGWLHVGVRPDAIVGLPVQADPVADLRAELDRLGEPHPALELGLTRLAAPRPPPNEPTVVHGDFRLGNLMVDPSGIVGVLDWELAHVGDPAEDLGWLCVRSWRFGGPLPVAGVGERQDLLDAYAAAGGPPVDLATLLWWEALGNARWGVICVRQASLHLTGAVPSVELAAIGRRTCVVELDLLDLVAPSSRPADNVPSPYDDSFAGPHDRPTVAETVDAVQQWLGGLSLPPRDAFLAKVVHRQLDVVAREAELGPGQQAAHRERLAALGVSSDAELAAQIRAGRDDAGVEEAVRSAVVDKVRVADPRRLG
ncbi:MAG: phosphotransferase family protein [Frankiales bacterium]|nr:phosphotransferase family protein [Frankiales bacterium]